MSAIASAAPAVLVAHMAAHTERIRLGAGGVMLPNHSPLTIAEQYGTLAELHPGRIDLGLGRAPGGDQATFAALRAAGPIRPPTSSPRDVVELQAYLRDSSRVPGVRATPVPAPTSTLHPRVRCSGRSWRPSSVCRTPSRHISLPQALTEAVALYRREFRPAPLPDGGRRSPTSSPGSPRSPTTTQRAQQQRHAAKLQRIKHLVGHHRSLTDDEAQALVDSPVGRQVEEMVRYSAVGTPTMWQPSWRRLPSMPTPTN